MTMHAIPAGPAVAEEPAPTRRGRPRSDIAHQAILDAFRDQLVTVGFTRLKLEHVAAQAGVGKATIYRRWASKEALALAVLLELTSPYIAVPELGSTRAEMEMLVGSVIRALTQTTAGPVIRALLSQFAANPALGDPFRATVVRARREEVARVIARGIARGDLRPETDAGIATELLVGPVYFRLMFGGELSQALGPQVVDALLAGWGQAPVPADR
ncbi:MAG: TetR/AcrR family transcriptional regulator [Chloroflexota bacterium]